MTSGPCFSLFIFYSPGAPRVFSLFQMLFFRLVDRTAGVTTLGYTLEFRPPGQGSLSPVLTQLRVLCESDLGDALSVVLPLSESRIQFLILKSPNSDGNRSHILCGKLSLEDTHQELGCRHKALTLLMYSYLIYRQNWAHFHILIVSMTYWQVFDYTSRGPPPPAHGPFSHYCFPSSPPDLSSSPSRYKICRGKNDASDKIKRSPNNPHWRYKTQNFDSVSLGRPVVFRDSYEIVRSDLVKYFSKRATDSNIVRKSHWISLSFWFAGFTEGWNKNIITIFLNRLCNLPEVWQLDSPHS